MAMKEAKGQRTVSPAGPRGATTELSQQGGIRAWAGCPGRGSRSPQGVFALVLAGEKSTHIPWCVASGDASVCSRGMEAGKALTWCT